MSVRPSAPREFVFTSESVSEGHPDKVCDLIADSILDAHLAGDRNARVACEVLCKGGDVVLAGEITSAATVDAASIARDVIRRIGYTDPGEPFNADGVSIRELITRGRSETPSREPPAPLRGLAIRGSCSDMPRMRRPSGCRCRSSSRTGSPRSSPGTATWDASPGSVRTRRLRSA